MGEDGYICLADFGSTKYTKNDVARTCVGTPVYMAPELIVSGENNKAYGESVDRWPIGMLNYELLYNKLA